jgi:Zn-dependent protease
MFRSFKLGTAFGIGIYVHWTFLILLAIVLFGDVTSGRLSLAVFEAAWILSLFGCVVLHELGHALAARYYGITTRDITLYPIGGVARLERLNDRPIEELCIAIAGPAVNLVIAAFLIGLLVLQGTVLPSGQALLSLEGQGFLGALLISNVMLLVFNLLPAFPSDGGRVLRAVLAIWLGKVPATRIAAGVGAGMALYLFLSGAFPGMFLTPIWPFLQALWGISGPIPESMPMLMLVAVFLFFAGRQELAAVEYQAAHPHVLPATVFPATAEIELPLGGRGGFSGFIWDPGTRVWVQWQDGRPIRGLSDE